MQHGTKHSTIIISAILTSLIVMLAGGIALAKGSLALPSARSIDTTQMNLAADTGQSVAAGSTAQTSQTGCVTTSDPSAAQVAAAYKAKLDEAYTALQQAYAQIQTLQANQNSNNSFRNNHEFGESSERGGD